MNQRSSRSPLCYEDVVLLKWLKPEAYAVCSEGSSSENSVESLVLTKNISDLKLASFKIMKAGNNQNSHLHHESEIKLLHTHSRKYLSKPSSGTDGTNINLVSDICKFKILKLTGNGQIFEGDKVTCQADSYTLTWDTSAKRFTWHKPQTNNLLEYAFTIHCIIPEGINEAIQECLQMIKLEGKLEEEIKNPASESNKYRLIQNYLRDPFCHDNSIELLHEFCKFICDCCNCSIHNEYMTKLIRLLTKICVGNIKIQQILLNLESQVLEITISEILKKPLDGCVKQHFNCNQTYWKLQKSNKKELQDLIELKASAVSLLEVFCEEIHEDTATNAQTLVTHIEIIDLHETLYSCYMLRNVKGDGIGELARDTAIKTYNLLKHLEDFKGIKAVPPKHHLKSGDCNPLSEDIDAYYDRQSTLGHNHQKAWNFCYEHSRSLEIIYKNEEGDKRLTKVHFRLHHEDEMTKKEECIVKHAVNCGAPKYRLKQFLLGMESIKEKVHPRLFENVYCPFHRTSFVAFSQLLNYFLTIWTVVMNILLIVAWESVDMKSEYVYISPDAMSTANESMLNRYCIDAVCYNNNVNSSMFMPEDCNRSLCVYKSLTPTEPDISDHTFHWFFSYAGVLYIGGGIHLMMSVIMVASFFIIHTPDVEFPRLKKVPYNIYLLLLDKDKPPDQFSRKIPRYFKISLHSFVFNSTYVIGFLTCSALSLKYYGYFYCFCLLHIVVDNVILQRILKSISRNSFKLLLIVVLAMGVIFIYSVAAFAFFANEFDNLDTQYCKSILQCYITIVHFILIHQDSTFPANFKDFALRVIIFDVSFYVILIVIGISTISAIVTSTFIELKEEWWQIERDRRQICFICQKFSSEFEKKAQLHIEKVDKDKRNAMERYYLKKIEEENTEFFPLRAAKCINDPEIEKHITDREYNNALDAQMQNEQTTRI